MGEIDQFKNGPQLVLDHTVLYQLLSSPKFYSQVPSFHYLKEQGLAITKQILDATLGREKSCAGCSSLQTSMGPIMANFGKHLTKLHEDSPEAIEPLVLYISQKKGYRPMPIVLYYKAESGVQTLRI